MASVRTSRSRLARPAPQRTLRTPLDAARAHEVVWDRVSGVFEASASIQNAHFVYFIGETGGGALKIGEAKNPITRLRTMQTGNPRRLRLERVLLGDRAIEKLLHELWAEHGIYSSPRAQRPDALPDTEWFSQSIRSQLFPIVEDAAERQLDIVQAATAAISLGDLEVAVRQAHADAGFIAKGRDEVRLLAAGAGEVVRNRSRI